jgi:transposase
VINRVMDGQLTVSEAGQALGRSGRQIYRLLRQMRKDGIKGILHGNRGNCFAQKLSPNCKEKILRKIKAFYQDINDTHLTELLLESEKFRLVVPA